MRGHVSSENQILCIERIDQSLPWVAVRSHSLRTATDCLVREQKLERSRTFNRIYQVLHIQMSSWRTNRAKILCWDASDQVLGRIDI